MRRAPLKFVLPLMLAGGLLLLAGALAAQQDAGLTDPAETRRALLDAQAQGDAARRRAEALEAQAAATAADAESSAAQAAAAAARIQQAEAAVTVQTAGVAIIDRQREAVRARLAERQQPLLRLTAALQRMARRPLAFTLLRPGSVRDSMHLRALLATMLPEVSRRTADLRAELDHARQLRARADATIAALRREQADLAHRRTTLAALEARQRLTATQTAGSADREAERALGLAEQARDLGTLADDLGRAGALRRQLAELPGPVIRPDRPGELPSAPVQTAAITPAHPALSFILPVQGRLVAGFGEARPGQPVSRGVSIAAAPGAQAVAPAPGRVVFAGNYRGFGQIAIIEHGDGWTSLVTGLAQLTARVGDMVVAGSPLGTAGPGRPVVNLEVRQGGQPVNPLDVARL